MPLLNISAGLMLEIAALTLILSPIAITVAEVLQFASTGEKKGIFRLFYEMLEIDPAPSTLWIELITTLDMDALFATRLLETVGGLPVQSNVLIDASEELKISLMQIFEKSSFAGV